MEVMQIEIERYISICPLADATKIIYKRKLFIFLEDFCILTDSIPSEIHLEKIYEIIDQSGTTKAYRGLDNKLLDEYLFSKINCGYSWLYYMTNALSGFFKYLNRNYNFPNLMKTSSFSIKDYKTLKKQQIILKRHHVLKFLESLISHSKIYDRDVLLFLLLISTGCRISELLSTVVSEIDFENELIYKKTTKNKSSKNIVLRRGFGKILKTYVKNNNLLENDYLFLQDNKKLTRDNAQQLFSFYLEKANLPNITLHSLRHTFSTLLYESGADISIIQQLLGHKEMNSTKTYIEGHYSRNIGIHIEENQFIFKHIKR